MTNSLRLITKTRKVLLVSACVLGIVLGGFFVVRQQAAAQAGQPDLVVERIEVTPAAPAVYGRVYIKVTYKNIGLAGVMSTNWSAAKNFTDQSNTIQFTLESLAPTVSGSYPRPEDPFEPGETLTETYYGFFRKTGTYVLSVTTDSSNAIVESDETNNILTQQVTVGNEKPDLFIESVSQPIPNNVTPGVKDVAVYIKQFGSSSGFTPFSVKLENPATGYQDIKTVTSHVQKNVDFSLTQGSYALTITIDSTNAVEEPNEGNNTFFKQVTIEGTPTAEARPDLKVESITIGTKFTGTSPFIMEVPQEGDLVAVQVKVVNVGTVASPYQFPYNFSYSPWGQTASARIDEIAPGGNRVLHMTLGTLRAGSYTTKVVLDPNNEVVEANDGNNTFSHAFTVQGKTSSEGGQVSITNVRAGNITSTSATIAWNTSRNANSKVFFWEEGSSNVLSRANLAFNGTDHKVDLTNLTPGVRYQYYVAYDGVSDTYKSATYSFATLVGTPGNAVDATEGSGRVSNANQTTSGRVAKISWQTDGRYNCRVVFKGRSDISDDLLSAGAGISVLYAGENNNTTVNLDELSLSNRENERVVYYKIVCRDRTDGHKVTESTVYKIELPAASAARPPVSSTVTPIENDPDAGGNEEVRSLRERIKRLELRISDIEKQVVERERQLTARINEVLTKRVAGNILLQVQGNGEAWYVDPITEQRFYLRDGQGAYQALQAFGLGVKTFDLSKIPIGIEKRFQDVDSDGDGLFDKLEQSLGTNPNDRDSDKDGFSDGEEIHNGYDPRGNGQLIYDSKLSQRLNGRILIDVDGMGRAWYVKGGKRYYLKDGDSAYQIMRFLSLGITNENLRKIAVGEFK